jgi:4-amino-4-deoxy-L-arabinose transferase-like glycosyltransferase
MTAPILKSGSVDQRIFVRRVLLSLLLAAVCLTGLWSASAGTHPDEATYLSIAAEMADRGAWATTWLEGEPNFYKPPLFYWAQRVSMGVLGPTLFAGRLPSALSALVLALLVGALARRMGGAASGGVSGSLNREALAALLTVTSFGLLRFGRVAMMDASLTLALAVAAYGVWRGVEEKAPRAFLWCGAGAGAAVMLKGPVGALLVLLLCVGFTAVRAPRLLLGRYPLAAVGLAALLAVPWFAVAFAEHGRAFFDSFFLRENAGKFSGAWTLSGEAGLLGAGLVLTLPWTFLFLGGLRGLRQWREPARLLPAVWIGALVLVYSLPSVKFPHYLLPCVPAAVLLAVRAPPPAWARWATAALLGLVALAAALLLRLPLSPVALASLAVVAGLFAAASFLAARCRLAPAALCVAAATALLLTAVFPAVNPSPLPDSALEAAGDRALYFYGGNAGLYRFEAHRLVRRAWNEEHFAGSLREGALVIVSAADFEALSEATRGQATPAARWPRLKRRLPVSAFLDAWKGRDLAPLYEEMLLVNRSGN